MAEARSSRRDPTARPRRPLKPGEPGDGADGYPADQAEEQRFDEGLEAAPGEAEAPEDFPHVPEGESPRPVQNERQDVSPRRLSPLDYHLLKGVWQAQAIEELVDQNMIADLQGRQHRARRDLERLHDEAADEDGQ